MSEAVESAATVPCPKCGKLVNPAATKCGFCWTKLTPAVVEAPQRSIAAGSAQGLLQPSAESSRASSVTARYRDAYLVAKTIDGFGTVIKVGGLWLSGLSFLSIAVAVSASSAHGEIKAALMLSVLVGSVVVAALFYLLGVLVSAQGQILKASLDTAVNSSPFLSDEQRARAMSL